MVNIYID